MASNKFSETWKFPNEHRQQFGTYTRFNVIPLKECFDSGRPKFLCTFSNTDGLIYSKNYAMQLTSKKTNKPYYVVSVHTCDYDDEAKAKYLAKKDSFGKMKDENVVEEEEEEDNDENYGSKPEPLGFKTRDFKRGHVEHTL